MKRFFADTAYWIALTNSFDQYHTKAVEVSATLGNCRLFTTETVLTEFLNALADKGPRVRAAAVEMVEAIMNNPHVTVIRKTDAHLAEVWRSTKPDLIKGTV